MRFIYIYKTIFLVGLVSYPDSTVFAQTDDTLPQVTVSHYRTQTGVHQQVFDSAQKMRSAGMTMADLLSQSGQAYIKQYGPGNIATANIRGGSSYHTTLLWNGINLINPMLGNSDLSLFPSVFSDISQVQFGTNSSLWGSGNISGSIQTDNPTVFSKHLKISAGIGLTSLNA